MTETAQPPRNRLTWPVPIYLAAAIVAVALHVAWPLGWVGPPLADMIFILGLLVAAAGLALVLAAVSAMRRANTTLRPDGASAQLATGGPFAISRNPVYLGFTLLLIGAGLSAGILWLPAAAVLAAFAVNWLNIVPEERALDARFGKRYRDYRKRVRRWI